MPDIPDASDASDPLRAAAREGPDAPALEDEHGRWSYRELDRAADGVARRLVGAGLEPGDRVACLLPAGREAAAALHGVPRAGAALAPLHPDWTEPELRDFLRRLRPRVFLCDVGTEDRAASLLRASGLLVRLGFGGGPGTGGSPPAPAVALDDLPEADDLPGPDPEADHTVLATSGTSGRPRGVRLTLANHLACQRAAARRMGLGPDDRWLASLSPAHVGGVALFLRTAVTGSRLVVGGRFRAGAFLELAEESRVTHASLVPTMLRRVLEARGDRPAPEGLRGILVGGDAADPDMVAGALERGWPLHPTYGLTEAASQVATATPDEARERPGTVGRPLDGVEVRIREGEIQVRGPTVAAGYLGRARAAGAVVREGRTIPRQGEPAPDDADESAGEAAAVGARGGDTAGEGASADDGSGASGPPALTDPEGWLATGDAGELDDDGFLYVTGRLSARIVTGGVTVDPAEVERVLRGHPEVRDACVVGMPDEEWGERVVAAVALDPDAPEAERGQPLDEAALAVWFGDRLAPPKRPRLVRFVEELPRNASGKVDLPAVRALFE